MVDSREHLFRCDFVGESVHVFSHVRAWDAQEALSAFVAELERDGIGVDGEIRVVPVRGGRASIARYAPGRPSPGTTAQPPAGG